MNIKRGTKFKSPNFGSSPDHWGDGRCWRAVRETPAGLVVRPERIPLRRKTSPYDLVIAANSEGLA